MITHVYGYHRPIETSGQTPTLIYAEVQNPPSQPHLSGCEPLLGLSLQGI